MGWITGCPPIAQLTSTLVQGLVVLLWNPDANVDALWQTTLFIMLVPGRRDCLQRLLRETTPTDGRYLHGRSRGSVSSPSSSSCGSPAIMPPPTKSSPGSKITAAGATRGSRSLVGITTLPWCFLGGPGRKRSHVRRAQGRFARAGLGPDGGVSVCNALAGLATLCFCLGPNWQDDVLGSGQPLRRRRASPSSRSCITRGIPSLRRHL